MPPQKPMLAGKADLSLLRFPILASPKIDGIRCIVWNGTAYSRKLKPLPNNYLQRWADTNWEQLQGLDGELVVGSSVAHDCYRRTASGIMSRDGEPAFNFLTFDTQRNPDWPYNRRFKPILARRVTPLEQQVVENLEDLLEFEKKWLFEGYEGLMLRDPDAMYKFGRATTRGGELLKLKRFEDAEAEIIGFEEEQRNDNEATISETGHTKRSSHKANKTGKGRLGAFCCRTTGGQQFNVGSGFTAEQRAEFWDDRASLVGKTVTYRYFSVGVKDAPRHPTFLRFRED